MTNYHIENTIEYEKYFRFTDGSLQCSNDTINNLLNILGLTKELEMHEAPKKKKAARNTERGTKVNNPVKEKINSKNKEEIQGEGKEL